MQNAKRRCPLLMAAGISLLMRTEHEGEFTRREGAHRGLATVEQGRRRRGAVAGARAGAAATGAAAADSAASRGSEAIFVHREASPAAAGTGAPHEEHAMLDGVHRGEALHDDGARLADAVHAIHGLLLRRSIWRSLFF